MTGTGETIILQPDEAFRPLRVPSAGNPDRAMILGVIEKLPPALPSFWVMAAIPLACGLGCLIGAAIVMSGFQYLFSHVRIIWVV